MDVLSEYAKAELVIKKSRFFAEVFPVATQEQARSLLKEQKAKYLDATHVVHAFVIGSKAEVMGMSDDGEPSGTAGRPVLDVLKGKNCTNIMLTVTRWFGGTLLGTGGLVKAYSESAKTVLNLAFFHELVEKTVFDFSVSYDQYELVKRFLMSIDASEIREEFDVAVKIQGKILSCHKQSLQKYITELSKGQTSVAFTECGMC
ncbi:MAG: YigZ family protein [Spirochaetaceae bacterium]|nr:YigZ family protein [Spirochaetaceae bacterium]